MFNDLNVISLRHRRIAVVVQLEDFAFRHLLAGFREYFIDPLTAEFDHLAHGLGIEIIADEDANLISPNFSGCSTSSSDLGIIHNIIVEEGRGMDKLDQTAELMMFPAGVAAETRTEEKEERADALAPAVENMRCDSVDEGDTGGQVGMDPNLNPLKLTPIGVPYVRHRMYRGGDRTLWHAADGRAAQRTKSRETQRNPCIRRLDRRITLPLI